MIFHINRDEEINFERMRDTNTPQYFKYEHLPYSTYQLSEINTDQIELHILFEQKVKSSEVKEANQKIKNQIQIFKEQGFLFVDAQVLEYLFFKNLLPKEWEELSDSDVPGRMDGSLRFDGTWFHHLIDGERQVLTPFQSRGKWSSGRVNYLLEKEIWGRDRFVRHYTVLYNLS